ncbi:FeoA domain-containing protein [candidate division WOR-3 bacterium]|nr:FeoA domain-containing protein [candidate division WOR-3 bacterium]
MNEKDKISEILKIMREDILRTLAEEDKKLTLKSLTAEITGDLSLMSEAIGILQKEGLLSIDEGSFFLTSSGKEHAEEIMKKHLVLEEFFLTRGEIDKAHKMAHILEHYIKNEVLNNIKKLSTLKEEGIPLLKFGKDKTALITDMPFSDTRLLERLVSMGVLPGEIIELTNVIPGACVVHINNKKIVMDKSIASQIRVFKYEEN